MEQIIFKRITNIIRNNFSEFDEYYNKYKLQFVKLIKEKDKEIGLKEAKDASDYLFENEKFFKNLNIVEERKKKLKKLYRKTLLEKFLKDFKKIDNEKLLKAFIKLPDETLDILLKELGYGDKE